MTTSPADTLLALLKTHSVLRGDFTLSSGQKSDTYIDVRRTILRSDGLRAAGQALYHLLKSTADVNLVAGLALGATPLTTAIAYEAALNNQPDFYGIIVRKSPKGHGTNRRIEPTLTHIPDAEVVAIDDVITTAGSTINAIDALRDAGYTVNHALCIIDRQAGGQEALQNIGVQLHSLFTLYQLLLP